MEKLDQTINMSKNIKDYEIIIKLEDNELINSQTLPFELPDCKLEIEFASKVKVLFDNFTFTDQYNDAVIKKNNELFNECYEKYFELQEENTPFSKFSYEEFIKLLTKIMKEFHEYTNPSIILSREGNELLFEYIEILRSNFSAAENEFEIINYNSKEYVVMSIYSKEWLDSVTCSTLSFSCKELKDYLIYIETQGHDKNFIDFDFDPRHIYKYFFVEYYYTKTDFENFKSKVQSINESLRILVFKHFI